MQQSINFDRLLYPIMMQIRSLKDLPQGVFNQDHLNKSVLECQNKVESMILSLMRFSIDLLLEGPLKVKLLYGQEASTIRKELLVKYQTLIEHFKKVDVNKLKRKITDELYHGDGFYASESENEVDDESFQIKLTGQLREFVPEILELKTINQQLAEENSQLREKISHRQNSLDILAQTHLKEIQNMKLQLQSKEQQGDQFELFEVNYFDQTVMLDPQIIEMMNEKIRDIKRQYERYVQQSMQRRQSIHIKETTPKHSVVYVDQTPNISAKDHIKLALEKETNPYVIVRILQDLKFNFLIIFKNQQCGYGINYQEINDFIKNNNNRQLVKELHQCRGQMEELLAQVSAQYLGDMEEHRKEVNYLKMQLESQRSEYEERVHDLESVNQNNLMHKYNLLEDELLNQQSMINSLRQEIKNYNFRCTQLINNLKFILTHINLRNKHINLQYDNQDLFKEKSDIVKDIQAKVKNLDENKSVAISQLIQLIYYQIFTLEIVSEVQPIKKNKLIQTDNFDIIRNDKQDFEPKIKKEAKKKTIKVQFEKNVKNSFTQTDTLLQTPSTPQPIKFNSEMLQNLYKEQVEQRDYSPQYGDSSQTIEQNVFDKLYSETRKNNLRIKSIKMFIERLSEEEFRELYTTLSVHQYKAQHFSQNQYTQYSNPIVDLPQQEIPQSLMSSKQMTQCIKKSSRIKDCSLDNKYQVFIELDDQREQAQKQFEQQRIDTYRRRLKRLIPVPMSQSLQIDEKLRPKSQQRKKLQHINF